MKIFSSLFAALALTGSLTSATEESLAALRGATARKLSYDNYKDCFYDIKGDTLYPLDTDGDTLADDFSGGVSLGFGPYHSYCAKTEKFHSGVSIHANEDTPVCAVYGGVVHAIYGSEGSYTIVIKHAFKEGQPCNYLDFHAGTDGYWYSVYRHLKTKNVEVGNPITLNGDTCIVIGTLGTHTCSDGTPLASSLSFEVRLGYHSSYEWCSTHHGAANCFDPKINGMMAFYKQSPDFVIGVPPETVSYGSDYEVTISQPTNLMTLNEIVVECSLGSGSQETTKSYTIDLNVREGFTYNTIAQDYHQQNSKPHIDVSNSATSSTKLVIPSSYITCSTLETTECTVTAIDIWHQNKYEKFEIDVAPAC